MRRVTTYSLILLILTLISFTIFSCTSCSEKSSEQSTDNDSKKVLSNIMGEDGHLIGLYADKSGGKAQMKISKEGDLYVAKLKRKGKWNAPIVLKDVSDKGLGSLFGKNHKDYIEKGLANNKAGFAIFKVKKGYKAKEHTFKTGYFGLSRIGGGKNIYKLE